MKRPLMGDAHAEAFRNAQLASLAEGALVPIIEGFERATIDKLVALGRSKEVPPHEVWVIVGELSGYAHLRAHIRSAKAGVAKLEK